MGAIRKLCGKNVDLGMFLTIFCTKHSSLSRNRAIVFVDAPHVLEPVDLNSFSSNALNASETSATDESKPKDPSEIPRGWWRSNPEKTIYHGASESLVVLRDVLAKDRYEVCHMSPPQFLVLYSIIISLRVSLALVKEGQWRLSFQQRYVN